MDRYMDSAGERRSTSGVSRRNRAGRPALETLEGRLCLSAAPAIASATTTTLGSVSIGDATGAVVLAASVSYSTQTDGVPSGSVEFDDLTTHQVLGTAKLDSSGLASILVDSGKSIANDTIRAAYLGGPSATPSHDDEAVRATTTAAPDPTPTTSDTRTTFALAARPNPTSPANVTTLAFDTPSVGTNAGPIGLHARVSYKNRSSGVPSGTVRFDDLTSQNLLGIAGVTPAGDATFVLPPGLSAVNHTIRATFLGGTTADPSQADRTVVLETPAPTPAATTTTLDTPGSAQRGASIELKAHVNYAVAASSGPSGSVEFDDLTTNKVLGTVSLDPSGVATLQVPAGLSVAGNHTIRAAFQGTSTAAASHADGAIQVMDFTTSVALAAPTSATESTPVTINAVVTSPAGTVVSGSVSFLDGGTSIGSSPLNTSGAAALTLSSLAVGSHSLTASFTPAQGSDFHASTTSAPKALQIVPTTTTPIPASSTPTTPTTPITPTTPTTPTTPATSTQPIASMTTLSASLLRPGPHSGHRLQVQFLAHVSSTASSASRGQVAFLVAGQRVSVVSLDANGNATFALPPGRVFRKPVMAQFLGGSADQTSLLASQSPALVTSRRTLMGRG